MAGFSCSVLTEGSEGRGNGLMLECGRTGLTAVVNSSGFHAILMRMHCSSQHLPGQHCIGVLRQCGMGIRLLWCVAAAVWSGLWRRLCVGWRWLVGHLLLLCIRATKYICRLGHIYLFSNGGIL